MRLEQNGDTPLPEHSANYALGDAAHRATGKKCASRFGGFRLLALRHARNLQLVARSRRKSGD